MIRIILSGYSGKMGQSIIGVAAHQKDVRIVAGITRKDIVASPLPLFKSLETCTLEADVLLDFTNPENFLSVIKFSKEKKMPLVIGTTGLDTTQLEVLNNLSKVTQVLHSANMSIGFNIFLDTVQLAAKYLHKEYDIEIIEKHHSTKIDAPSGSALLIKNAIKKVTDSSNEISIHSIRAGNIVGQHDVIMVGEDECIEIMHTANSKDIFSRGTLQAARFLVKQNIGMYTINDIMKV